MLTYSIYNQKGGVGKTTLTVNLAANLAARGRRVLAVDLDAGAGLTTALKVDAARDVADFIRGPGSPADFAVNVRPGLDVIPANKAALAALEYDAVLTADRARLTLKRRLAPGGYDVALLDCGPGVSLLNVNAILAAGALIVPVLADYLSLAALAGLVADLGAYTGALGAAAVPPVAAVVPMMINTRRRVTAQVLAALRRDFRGRVAPAVRVSARFVEAPSYGQTIFEYDAKGNGAADMAAVADFIFKLKR